MLIFHAGADWLPAGFLGVDVFFVISGFLITLLLLREWSEHGAIALQRFWMRRAARLLPALLLLLGLTGLYLAAISPAAVTGFLTDARFAILFVANWDFVLRQVSYFAQWQPALATHLWSLAVEEQFYLVWPPLVVLIMRIGGVRHLAVLAGLLAVAATVLMATLYVPWEDVSRIYYGTDTHLSGLAWGALLGCLVAMSNPGLRLPPLAGSALGAGALAGLTAMMVFLHEWDGLLYRGGFLLAAVLTGIVLIAALGRQGPLVRLLAWSPFRWIGKRSYAIYLWHWPLLVIDLPLLDRVPPAVDLAGRVGMVIALAAISWYVVEAPVRQSVAKALANVGRRGPGLTRATLASLLKIPVSSTVCIGSLAAFSIVAALAFGGWFPQSQSDIADQIAANARLLESINSPTQPAPAPQATSRPVVPANATPAVQDLIKADNAAPQPTAAPGVGAGEDNQIVVFSSPLLTVGYDPASERAPPVRRRPINLPVLAIGDSVMLGATPTLLTAVPQLQIDATVAKQFADGIDRIRSALATPPAHRPRVIVVHLGTNGIFDPAHLDQMRQLSRSLRRLVVINIRAPRSWEGFVNEQLEAAAEWKSVRFVDWYEASAENPDWLADDGVHLSPAGQAAYADLIANAIAFG